MVYGLLIIMLNTSIKSLKISCHGHSLQPTYWPTYVVAKIAATSTCAFPCSVPQIPHVIVQQDKHDKTEEILFLQLYRVIVGKLAFACPLE